MMNDYLTNNVKKEVDKIKIPEEALDQAIKSAINKGKRNQRSLGKKVIYFSSAAVFLFGLLIGSAFVSPAMARVVSKIPYLGQIFESKNDIVTVITEELRAKGYKTSGAGVSFPEKKIVIDIQGSEKYFVAVKEDVERVASEILQSKGYDAYTLKVSRYKERKVEVDPKDEKKMNQYNKEYEIIHNAATEALKSRNFNVLSLSMGYSPRTLEIAIPDTETRIDEMKQVVNQILKENRIDYIPLNIKKIDMEKRDQDRRWIEILRIVREDLLGKKDYKVRMVGYSVHPEPEIQMFITLPSSDENAKEFAQQLEKVIDNFLKSEQMKSRVKNDPYHITIYSKDDKIIN